MQLWRIYVYASGLIQCAFLMGKVRLCLSPQGGIHSTFGTDSSGFGGQVESDRASRAKTAD